MNIVAVIVTYNRLHQLRPTLERLLAEPLDRIVLVDNLSTDGTRDYLAGLSDPRLDILLSETNLGGAGGFEHGMRHAVDIYDPDWLLLSDDDGRPEAGAIAEFRTSDLERWDAVAAAVRYPDGSICGMNRPVLNPFWHPSIFLRTFAGGGRAAFHLGDRDFAQHDALRVDGASFVGLFLSRRAVRMAGFPDGRLFIYADDGIYTLGLTKAGGQIGFLPAIRFEHDCSTFIGGSVRFSPAWKSYYYHRNLLFLYRRAAGPFFWPALLIVLPKWLWKARAQGQDRGVYLSNLWRAIKDGLGGRIPPVTPP